MVHRLRSGTILLSSAPISVSKTRRKPRQWWSAPWPPSQKCRFGRRRRRKNRLTVRREAANERSPPLGSRRRNFLRQDSSLEGHRTRCEEGRDRDPHRLEWCWKINTDDDHLRHTAGPDRK